MEAILISIKPEWVAKILNGEKTIEIRKTAPKCDLPIDVYIYCSHGNKLHDLRKENVGVEFGLTNSKSNNVVWSNPPILNGKVVAKFSCFVNGYLDKVSLLKMAGGHGDSLLNDMCLTLDELKAYAKGNVVYLWHISDLVIFDEPMELSDLGVESAPRSWCYVETGKYNLLKEVLK